MKSQTSARTIISASRATAVSEKRGIIPINIKALMSGTFASDVRRAGGQDERLESINFLRPSVPSLGPPLARYKIQKGPSDVASPNRPKKKLSEQSQICRPLPLPSLLLCNDSILWRTDSSAGSGIEKKSAGEQDSRKRGISVSNNSEV